VHTLPHEPQLLLSLAVFAQSPSPRFAPVAHCVKPVVQAHVPSLQATPPGHAVPHNPQFRLSTQVLTQPASQGVEPTAQLSVHEPETQVVFP
jgi:hypothetical protein